MTEEAEVGLNGRCWMRRCSRVVAKVIRYHDKKVKVCQMHSSLDGKGCLKFYGN